MIYLENSNDIQEVFIPRIELNSSASPEYATKTELENAIENEVIRADAKYATKTDLLPYATTGWVVSQDYVNSEEMTSAITDAMASETARTEETYQKISEMSAYSTTNEVENMIDNAVSGKMDTSAMSAYSTTEEVEQLISAATDDMATETWVNSQGFLTEHQSLSAYSTTEQMNEAINEATSGKVDTSAMTAYSTTVQVQGMITAATSGKQDTLVSGTNIKTINGESILGSGNIEIQGGGGGSYSAGTNIQIENNVISVTGITVPTKLSDLENDEGYITSDALSGYSTTQEMNQAIDDAVSGKADSSAFSAYSTTSEVEEMIASAKTEIEAEIPSLDGYATETYVDNSVSGKADTSALTQYYTSAETDTAISNAVSGKMDTSAMTAYSTTQEMNTAIDNAVSGKMDTSGMSAYATTAFTEATYLKEHQSLAGLFASVDYVSSAKTIFFYDKDNTEVGTVDATDFIKDGMVDEVYISGDTLYIVFNSDAGKETIEIPLSDIFNPNNYYTKDEVDSAITAATSGKVDTSAMTAYYTSAQTDTEINNAVSGKADSSRVDEIEEVAASALTNLNSRVDELSGNSVTTGTVQSMITAATSGFASTTYVDNSVSGKADTSAVTADIASATAATTGWVENQGYLTGYTESDPIFTGSPAYGITSEDITNWNSVSGKVDTSAMTAYYTSGETNTAISNATSGLASQTWVENKGYLTAFTESDPVFMASPASGITAQDITNWNAVTGLTIPTSNTAFTNDAGYITEDAISGKADTTAVTQSIADAVSGKMDTSAMTQYATTGSIDSLTNRLDEVEEVAASALTNLNTRVNQISGSQITTGTVESMITTATSGFASTTYVDNSVSGKLDTTAFTAYTASTQTTLNAKVGSSDSSVSDIVKMSQNDYDSLTAKSSTTLYIIV